MKPDPLGYPSLDLGLNNQKAAVFGLFVRAAHGPRRLTLPRMSLFRSDRRGNEQVDFAKIFEVDTILRFADAFGLEIEPGEPVYNVEGYDCFNHGAGAMGAAARIGLSVVNDFQCQFFSHLVPLVIQHPAFRKLASTVLSDLKIKTVIQIRIEKDWIHYSNGALQYNSEHGEDFNPEFLQIFAKVKNTTEVPAKTAFVVCDEVNLPVPKDEIRREVEARHGITLVWKSDILSAEELANFSILELALLDYEMSALAPYFVGLSRSTFSDLLLFERMCRTRRPVTTHYIYNLPGPRLGRRMDGASEIAPSRVVDPLLARQPLIEPDDEDCRWAAELTCHVARTGDCHSESSSVHGIRGGPLVVGYRGSDFGLIEGFALRLAQGTPVDIEYRTLDSDGTWSPWTASGEFVGSRGRNSRIRGFTLRLVGAHARRFEALCAGSFVGHPHLIVARDGQDCCAPENQEMEAMQIVFRPYFHAWPKVFGPNSMPPTDVAEPLVEAPLPTEMLQQVS